MYLSVLIIVVLSGMALFLFQYMNQKRKIRQEEMHERKRQQFEELLKLISDKNDDPDNGRVTQRKMIRKPKVDKQNKSL